MSPKRDLSAFAAPAGLPAPPKAPRRPATARKPPARSTAATPAQADAAPTSTKRPKAKSAPKASPRKGKKRVCVSLTAETHDALRTIADERDVWKVEVILDGLDHWEPKLAAEKTMVERGRRRRSRRGSNPTPFVMDLTMDELSRLDGLTAKCATSRSAMVRQLIQLESTRRATPSS